MMPSTIPRRSRYASCASASYGATTYGMFSARSAYADALMNAPQHGRWEAARTHLDELERHLRRHVHTLAVVLACLCVFALRRQHVPTREVLLATLPALLLRAPFRRQRPTVEDDVWVDAVVPEQAHLLHRVLNVSATTAPRSLSSLHSR